MTKSVCEDLISLKTSDLMATYFWASGGGVDAPSNIIFKGKSGGLHELSADGCGGVKHGNNPFDRLFFDKSAGYSFIAPLLKVFGDLLDGSEKIQEVDFIQSLNKTIIKLHLDNGVSLEVRFEDDDIYFSIA